MLSLSNKSHLFIKVAFLFLGISIFTSCKNCTCDCNDVFVTVLDSLDKPVANADVYLTCDPIENPGCTLEFTQFTNTNGVAYFWICEPAILKVFVNGTAEGYIEIEKDEITEKTIKLD